MEHKAANRAPVHQRTQRTSHNRRAPMAPASKRPAAAPPLSDYEVKRARNVEENEQVLLALGIEPAVPRAPKLRVAGADGPAAEKVPTCNRDCGIELFSVVGWHGKNTRETVRVWQKCPKLSPGPCTPRPNRRIRNECG